MRITSASVQCSLYGLATQRHTEHLLTYRMRNQQTRAGPSCLGRQLLDIAFTLKTTGQPLKPSHPRSASLYTDRKLGSGLHVAFGPSLFKGLHGRAN